MPATVETPLNARQQRFVTEYLVDQNGTKAAIRAGYSQKTAAMIATENLRKPNIAAAVTAGMAKLAQRTEVTQEWVVRRLQEESVFYGEGASQSARVRAAELLGKHTGMFTDTAPPPPVVNVNVSGTVDLKQLNDDQLAQLTGLLNAAVPGPTVPPPAGR